MSVKYCLILDLSNFLYNVTRRMKFIQDETERDMLDNGECTKRELNVQLEYRKFMRTGKTDSYVDVFIYDFLLSMPQEMQIRYLFIFQGQQHLIKFCFLWLYLYRTAKERQNFHAREVCGKVNPWAKQRFIAVESEAERLVKQYGIKDSKPDEKFIKAVQKAAAAKGTTVAEYRDKILFPHGKERIKARFQKFLSLNPEAEGKSKLHTKYNFSKASTKNF